MRTRLSTVRWWVLMVAVVAVLALPVSGVAQPPPPGLDDRPGPEPVSDDRGGWPPKAPDRQMGPQDGPPGVPEPGNWQVKPPLVPKPPIRAGQLGPKFDQENVGPVAPAMPRMMEEKVLAFLRETDPGRLEELQRIRIEKPMAYGEVIRDIWREREDMERLKDRDPEEFKRRQRIHEIKLKLGPMLKEYRGVPEDNAKKRTELADPIKKLLDEEFELRQASREAKTARIEADLKREKDRLAKRRQNKGTLIDTHFKELVGENDGLRW